MIRIALLVCLSTAAAFAADPNPFTTAMMKSYTEMKQNFLESAALMPEEAYAYRLTPQQQSFGEWMYHAGIANFYYCQRYGAAPADRAVMNAGKGKTAKADLKKFIEDSFTYCDAALQGMTDAKAMTEITFGSAKVVPITFMVGMLTGLNEHWGNVVGYLRTKGFTPPSTAREAKK